MKQWYMIFVGVDCGGPESGPIFHCDKHCIKAKSLEKAEQRADRLVKENYPDGCEGYTVHLADEQELKDIAEQMKWTAIDMKYIREYGELQDVPFV